MKLITVVEAHNTLDSLADQQNIGAHLAYWMTKFVVKTQSDAEFYAASASKIYEEFGEKSEDGNLVVKGEKVEAFKEALAKLQNTEAEDPGIRFSLSELANELKLSMKQMYPLLDFIDEDK